MRLETETGRLSLSGGAIDLALASLKVGLAEQELFGNLQMELVIRDGAAEDLRFDFTGSSLLPNSVQIVGPTPSATDDDWHARLQLEDTEVLWQKPMHLDMQADVTVNDTRPFLAVLDKVNEQHGWIHELLTVEDLGGQ